MEKTGITYKKTAGLLFLLGAVCILAGCGNKYESSSLEDRDYVISMTILEREEEAGYAYSFVIADLTEYNGDSKNALNTTEYSCTAESLETAMHQYYDENDRQLDIGHVSELTVYSGEENTCAYAVAREISSMPMMAKSVPVRLVNREGERKIILRELIKEAYAGEEF